MASTKKTGKLKQRAAAGSQGAPPEPFKRPDDIFKGVLANLDPKHVYITHVDSHPAGFKRRIFLVPVAMNVIVIAAFLLRMYWILPWYWKLLASGFGYPNETTFNASRSSWVELSVEIGKRAIVMFVDFLLFVFVWPWPVQFLVGQENGSPAAWRLKVGFRDKEIYVRCSKSWDTTLSNLFKDVDPMKIFEAYIQAAVAPLVQEQKTGYLLMNAQWDLDWEAMMLCHACVDKKDIALDAFRNLVFVYHQDFGWLRYDIKAIVSADEDDKRRQMFAFRDALTAMGKEDLFYRWVEMVQFEASQPGGFGPQQQQVAAEKIRELFEAQDVNFDKVWKEAVATT